MPVLGFSHNYYEIPVIHSPTFGFSVFVNEPITLPTLVLTENTLRSFDIQTILEVELTVMENITLAPTSVTEIITTSLL